MHTKRIFLVTVALSLAAVVLLKLSQHDSGNVSVNRTNTAPPSVAKPSSNNASNSSAPGLHLSKIRRRATEFSDDEKAKFSADFEQKLKPAVAKWCQAYEGHVPFRLDEVSPENFVERFSKDSSYGEYVFVVNGVTLGVRDANGATQVDYLNDPQQTKLMATIPKRTEPLTTTIPVGRDEIMRILERESGFRFPAHEIRMKQSGFSGGLDGGVLVHVGGDPANGATWKHDLVFGPDGKLAYYLRGIN